MGARGKGVNFNFDTPHVVESQNSVIDDSMASVKFDVRQEMEIKNPIICVRRERNQSTGRAAGDGIFDMCAADSEVFYMVVVDGEFFGIRAVDCESFNMRKVASEQLQYVSGCIY